MAGSTTRDNFWKIGGSKVYTLSLQAIVYKNGSFFLFKIDDIKKLYKEIHPLYITWCGAAVSALGS
jgi:hypothetical protein